MEQNIIKWNLIIIDDPNLLEGKSILNVINCLLRGELFRYVILDDIEGTAQNGVITELRNKMNEILHLSALQEIVCKVQQFDWGDFFLFRDYPINWSNPRGRIYPYVITQTDVTVRAIDDQYIYIYTPHQLLVDEIQRNYKIESIKTDFLENLEYPC